MIQWRSGEFREREEWGILQVDLKWKGACKEEEEEEEEEDF